MGRILRTSAYNRMICIPHAHPQSSISRKPRHRLVCELYPNGTVVRWRLSMSAWNATEPLSPHALDASARSILLVDNSIPTAHTAVRLRCCSGYCVALAAVDDVVSGGWCLVLCPFEPLNLLSKFARCHRQPSRCVYSYPPTCRYSHRIRQ